MTKFSNIALLPIKANSERIKNKNFLDFCGKPLFRWILDTLLVVDEIDKIVINTDGRHILVDNGIIPSDRVIIRDRKPEICGDLVSMNLVLSDDIASIKSDVYLMTHATNPLLSSETIKDALATFNRERHTGGIDSLFTVDKLQDRFYRVDGSTVNHNPDDLIPTQDLEPLLKENSNLYIFTSESFAATNARIGRSPLMYDVPFLQAIDIDNPEDWELAVAVARYQQQR